MHTGNLQYNPGSSSSVGIPRKENALVSFLDPSSKSLNLFLAAVLKMLSSDPFFLYLWLFLLTCIWRVKRREGRGRRFRNRWYDVEGKDIPVEGSSLSIVLASIENLISSSKNLD